MTSCNYNLLNDLYNVVDADLSAIAQKLDDLDLSLKIDELDIDLDNLERQILISNKLKFLELVGTDIMSEEDQLATYNDIKEELFAPTISSPTLEEEEGGL